MRGTLARLVIITGMLALMSMGLPAVADEPNHVPGGPCAPDGWEMTEGILSYDQMVRHLNRIADSSHGRVTVHIAGQSGLGRDLPYAKVGSGPETYFMWGRIHGDEWVGTEAILQMLQHLAGGSQSARLIRENLTVVAIPMWNPDGSEAAQRRDVVHNIDLNRDWVAGGEPILPGTSSFIADESNAFYDLYIAEAPDWVMDIHTMGRAARVLPGTNDLVRAALGTAHEVEQTAAQFHASEQMGQVAMESMQKRGNVNVSRYQLSSQPGTPTRSALRRMMQDGRGPLGDAGPSHTPQGGFFFEMRDLDGLQHGSFVNLVKNASLDVMRTIAAGELADVDSTEFANTPFHRTVPCGND